MQIPVVAGAGCLLLFLTSAVAADEENHWAFQPLSPASPPGTHDPWIRNPVDAFILDGLRQKGLEPATTADPQDFNRRAHVVLTGLPPESRSDFPDDPNGDSHLIDRLLASPAFGVRWARTWLDVARYSDTKGYAYAVEHADFYHAWRYRDWVVDALNEDLPYDTFIQRQIAADRLLAQGECETRDLAAMGFLTIGRRFLGVEQDIVDDRIDVLTRGVLGLTAACARCHDHKFDPIPASDYYALYGIFKSSREHLIPLDQPSEDPELLKRWKDFDATFEKEASAVEKTFLQRVDEYLIATLDLSTVPPPAFSEIVVPDAIIPAQIRRWHEYLSLSSRKTDPVFAPWIRLKAVDNSAYEEVLNNLSDRANPLVLERLRTASPTTMVDVAGIYANLFRQAAAEESGTAWDAIRATMNSPDSPFRVPRRHPHDVEWLFHNAGQTAIKKAFAQVESQLVALGENAAYTVALEDRPVPQNMRVLLRGDYLNPGPEAARGNLSLFRNAPPVSKGSGRLELARNLTNPDNPLTARVIVNRLWHHYFGTGLVPTTSDFGLRATPPSHPELLDYLASQLIENDWSLKAIHRLIATSATFRQKAGAPPSTDPENRLLSCYPRRRLDFEAMRDALLQVSGELDRQIGGFPGELLGKNATPRRSLYGRIDRKFLPGELQVFDFANPELHSPRRYETNVPQQALFFLNSPFTMDRARVLARRVDQSNSEAAIERLFVSAFQRRPHPGERQNSLSFVNQPADPESTMNRWEQLAHALLLSNEFMFLD
ncbi:MAG: DUF1549 and DUF1553 domain-containing protein [Verrucomicrobiota bacterium]